MLRFQFLFTQLHILPGLHVLIQLLTVIPGQRLNVIGPVRHIGKALFCQKHFQIKGIPPLIHELNPLLHRRILFILLFNGRFQIPGSLLNLLFLFGDHIIILLYFLLYADQLFIQLRHIGRQIGFRLFQLFLELFHVCLVGLQTGNFLFCLLDLGLFLPNAVIGQSRLNRRHTSTYKSQTKHQTYPFFPVFQHANPLYTLRCFLTVVKLPKKPIPTPRPNETGTNT